MEKIRGIRKYLVFAITLGLLLLFIKIWLALFIAIVLSYSIYPLANFFYLITARSGLRKEIAWNISCSIAFIVFLTLILLCVFLLIPVLMHQIQILTTFLRNIRIDELWSNFRLLPFYENPDFQTVLKLIKSNLNKILEAGIESAVTLVQHITQSTSVLGTSFLSSVHNVFYSLLVLVLSFHLLRDRFKWRSRLGSLLSSEQFSRYRERVLNSADIFASSMRHMITGQVVLSAIMSVYYACAFMLTGFSPLLGIVFSFASIFPYLGDTLAFTLLLFDALSSGFVWTQFVSALILIGIGHNISSHLLTPILIGSYTGVLPVQILLGLMIHVHLLGGFGLIFNIPLCILERSILAFWRSDLIGDKNKKSS